MPILSSNQNTDKTTSDLVAANNFNVRVLTTGLGIVFMVVVMLAIVIIVCGKIGQRTEGRFNDALQIILSEPNISGSNVVPRFDV